MSRLSDRIMDCRLPLERVKSWSCLRPTQPRKLRCQRTRGAFKNNKKICGQESDKSFACCFAGCFAPRYRRHLQAPYRHLYGAGAAHAQCDLMIIAPWWLSTPALAIVSRSLALALWRATRLERLDECVFVFLRVYGGMEQNKGGFSESSSARTHAH